MPHTTDPFAPYINAPAPEILRELGPRENEPSAPGVVLRRVVFHSLSVPTPDGLRDNEVYAVIASPAAEGIYPGLLVLHGGGGTAEVEKAVQWAKRGYVAVAPDLPGIGEPTKTIDSAGYWREHPYGSGRWEIGEDWTTNTIVQAVTAALQSLALLRSQPNVDTSHIGVTGISWGGYTTTMLAGLAGENVKAAFSLYGSGHYENCVFNDKIQEASPEVRELWMQTLDAASRAGNMKATYFVAAAANDAFFYPPAVRDTLRDIPSPKNWVLAPNANHKMPIPGGEAEGDVSPLQAAFFEWHLKGEGAPMPSVQLKDISGSNVRFEVARAQGELRAELFYSLPDAAWVDRKWIAVPAAPVADAMYEVEVPAEARGADAFILVSDSRPVSASSELFCVTE